MTTEETQEALSSAYRLLGRLMSGFLEGGAIEDWATSEDEREVISTELGRLQDAFSDGRMPYPKRVAK